jgi:hypothetical protein
VQAGAAFPPPILYLLHRVQGAGETLCNEPVFIAFKCIYFNPFCSHLHVLASVLGCDDAASSLSSLKPD